MSAFEIGQTIIAALGLIGAGIVFLVGLCKYFSERRTEHFWKEFETYHKLVEELVSPSRNNGDMFIDRQAAIVFELSNFEGHYPYTLRMLKGLRQDWNDEKYKRLLDEIDLTIEFLEKKCAVKKDLKFCSSGGYVGSTAVATNGDIPSTNETITVP